MEKKTVHDFNFLIIYKNIMNNFLLRNSAYLVFTKLENKDQYYSDIDNIMCSLPPKCDIFNIDIFITESAQLLINAMELFEQGYFDCAYYSLRSSIEVIITTIYISEEPNDKEKIKYWKKWKNLDKFPTKSNMIKNMVGSRESFQDFQKNLKSFFKSAKSLSDELNKYVHKQGLYNFYIFQHSAFFNCKKVIAKIKSDESFVRKDPIEQFPNYLERCISFLAVIRLVIDPFPIILGEPEIRYRCPELLSIPYNESFIEKYISKETMEEYKQTYIYKSFYKALLSREKLTTEIAHIINAHYIDSSKINSILKSAHYLSKDALLAVLFVDEFPNCISVLSDFCIGYITEKTTNLHDHNWPIDLVSKFKQFDEHFNIPRYNHYITIIKLDSSVYVLHHEDIVEYDKILRVKLSVKNRSYHFNNHNENNQDGKQ